MGCVQCKICNNEEEKNQFEYPQSTLIKDENEEKNIINSEFYTYNTNMNTNSNINQTSPPNSVPFLNEFEEKLSSFGKYISEEEFQTILSENKDNFYQTNEPFPFHSKNQFHQKMKPIVLNQGNIYEGEWNENLEMDGYGKYFLNEDKVLAEGIWEKGELKKARIFYPNGEFYEGEMSNSCFNGKGKIIDINKNEFVGEFLNGEKTGEGKMSYNDGDEYIGNFMKNKFNGYGVFKWHIGIIYQGNFVNGLLEGKGILYWDEEKYDGNFEKNLFHGEGIYTYSNGDVYEGNFEYGVRKGKGIYKQKDGITFDGSWDNNVPNGFGKIYFNEKIIKCNYHNGKIIDKPVDEDGLYFNNIDYNFYLQKMNLPGQKLDHIPNPYMINSDYRARTILSFLEEEEEKEEE